MKPSMIYQDNQSAILLESNGRASSSKRTRHMNIRYFFVSDCQQRGHVMLRYCPTDEMIGDFFTKPLGGAKFRRFRNIIMNCSYDDFGIVDMDAIMTGHNKNINYSDMRDPESTVSGTLKTVDSQECVGTACSNKLERTYYSHQDVRKNRYVSDVRKNTYMPSAKKLAGVTPHPLDGCHVQCNATVDRMNCEPGMLIIQ